MKHLMKPLSRNQVDDLVSALVENLRYCDPSIEYPNVESAKSDDGVIAEWFYPIYAGANDFSELSAILIYTSQEAKYEELGELFLGIGLTEMKHYGKLGEFIKALGGKVKPHYDTKEVKIGNDILQALQISKEGEEKTIKFYEELLAKIAKVQETETTIIATQFINKLIADERVHLKLLNDAISDQMKVEVIDETAEEITDGKE